MNYASHFGQRRAIVGELVLVIILGDSPKVRLCQRIGIRETMDQAIDQLSSLGFCDDLWSVEDHQIEWSAIVPNLNGAHDMSIITKWR